ncbi:hypothetical protein D3C76_1664180 [compost metagenome]
MLPVLFILHSSALPALNEPLHIERGISGDQTVAFLREFHCDLHSPSLEQLADVIHRRMQIGHRLFRLEIGPDEINDDIL